MSSSSAIPYIGSKISLVTNSELRYEGILVNINTTNSTVTLKDVRMSGTENRKAPQYVMPCAEVFDYIIFNGRDIKDLTVSEPAFSVKEDPAVVAVNVAPPPNHQPAMNGYDSRMVDPHGHMGMYPDMVNQQHYGRPQNHMAGPDAYSHVHQRGYSPMSGRGIGMYSRGRDYYGPSSGYGYNRSFSGRGGRMMGGGTAPGGIPRNIVGELTAQPNTNLKTQVAQAFDFEQSNSKFEKGKVEVDNVKSSTQTYDKKASFFDNISCETLNRQSGRDSKVDREKQNELDTETFGPAATLTRGPRYYRRGYRRPNGGMRGRGFGGPNMYGRPMMGYYGGFGGMGGGPNQMLRAQ